jgi:hypothetical protein
VGCSSRHIRRIEDSELRYSDQLNVIVYRSVHQILNAIAKCTDWYFAEAHGAPNISIMGGLIGQCGATSRIRDARGTPAKHFQCYLAVAMQRTCSCRGPRFPKRAKKFAFHPSILTSPQPTSFAATYARSGCILLDRGFVVFTLDFRNHLS